MNKATRTSLICILLFSCTLILSFHFAIGADSSITLILLQPEHSQCGNVSINGVVSDSNANIVKLVWDWGDGTATESFFAASHRYSKNGTYTVQVTAHSSSCETATETTTVQITNAEGPSCESLVDTTEYVLFPYNLHLTANTTSNEPLVLRDQAGNKVSGTVEFFGFDSSLISVSPSGFVTALREEASNEIGTLVSAKIDGTVVNNTSIVRVLSKDHGISFEEIVGERTILYYPTQIAGEDLSNLVLQHQIPTLNEYAYQIQEDLVGFQPFNGAKQIFEVDFGETEQQRVCGSPAITSMGCFLS